MGTHPIGVNREWPCVGSPDGPMFACGAEGEFSIVGLADLADISGGNSHEPAVVHLTVCRQHVRGARAWLRRFTDEPIDVFPTEALLKHWGQFEDLPVWRVQRSA